MLGFIIPSQIRVLAKLEMFKQLHLLSGFMQWALQLILKTLNDLDALYTGQLLTHDGIYSA